LIGDLRVVFEKHNLELPTEINVVHELEDELTEHEKTIDKLVERVNELKSELQESKRQLHFNESTKDLTESQKERVLSIVERAQLSDIDFSDKLHTICEMVSGSNTKVEPTEMFHEGSENYSITTENVEADVNPQDINMQAYIAAAQNFAK